MRLMEGEHVGPFNLGNPGEFTMLELAKVRAFATLIYIPIFLWNCIVRIPLEYQLSLQRRGDHMPHCIFLCFHENLTSAPESSTWKNPDHSICW